MDCIQRHEHYYSTCICYEKYYWLFWILCYFQEAVCLPAFWSLAALFEIEIIGFGIIIYLKFLPCHCSTTFCFHDGIALTGIACLQTMFRIHVIDLCLSFIVNTSYTSYTSLYWSHSWLYSICFCCIRRR